MPNLLKARLSLGIAAALNLIPLAYTGLLIAPGTVVGGSGDARLRFIAAHQSLWSVAWVLWMGGALGLFLSIWVIARTMLPRAHGSNLLRIAPLIAMIGATCDLVGDAVQAVVYPALAGHYTDSSATYQTIRLLFEVSDRFVTMISPGTANLLYGVAGALVTIAMARIHGFPAWITALGGAAWIVTLLATPAVFFPAIVPGVVATALFLYAAWLVAVALWGLPSPRIDKPAPHLYRV